uniref:Uncharacterized protein n=1 Tax=Arundo donax TaxID=35708 RepID=A0A0A9DF07_ARUDO
MSLVVSVFFPLFFIFLFICNLVHSSSQQTSVACKMVQTAMHTGYR